MHGETESAERRIEQVDVARQGGARRRQFPQLFVQPIGRDSCWAAAEPLVERGENVRLSGLARVQFQAEIPESDLVEAVFHDLQCSLLVRDKQQIAAVGHRRRYDVGDRLRLAGAWRALNHQILPAQGIVNRAVLTRVRVQNQERHLGGHRGRVHVMFGREHGGFRFSAAKQGGKHGIRRQTAAPMFLIKVMKHRQPGEWKMSECHEAAHAPARAAFAHLVLDPSKVGFRRLIFGQSRQLDAKVAIQALGQSQVDFRLITGGTHRGTLAAAHDAPADIHPQQEQRTGDRPVGGVAFEPFKEAKGEV